MPLKSFIVYHVSSKKVYNKVYNIFVFVFLKGYRFSILQTAIANGIDAKLYLKTLIEKIGTNPSKNELENLLPWKINL